jgi:shikimate kinase
MKFDKVFLIGFMGCGKSTFGKKLAKQLNWDFVDLDDYIEKKEKASISEIFASKGETYFRSLESKAVKSTSNWKKTIISTGGGTPCFNDNISSINDAGLSVYIKISPIVLKSRLEGELSKRPLIADLTDAELLSFIENKLNERSADYSKSKIIFEYTDHTEASFVESLKAHLV